MKFMVLLAADLLVWVLGVALIEWADIKLTSLVMLWGVACAFVAGAACKCLKGKME